MGSGDARWDHYPTIIDELKQKARALGLWNMFLPKGHYKESPGFTNLEYGLMAEWLGKSKSASEAVNCAAPDTGNMEVLAKYGNNAQKAQWLKPLLEGQIRSAFLMTEPQVASSDATNIELEIRKEGNDFVLNGQVRTLSGTPSFAQSQLIVMTEMVVQWRRRHQVQDLHRHGQVRPSQQGPLPSAVCGSCASRHKGHHYPPHVECVRI